MVVDDLKEFLRNRSLFSLFSDRELEEIADRATVKNMGFGELLFEQGEAGEAFYVVYSGKIRIVRETEDGGEMNLGTRRAGDYFGESALVTDDTRNATARSAGESVVIRFDRDVFREYFYDKPELRAEFDKFIRNNSIHQFIRSCTQLKEVPPDEIRSLVRKLDSEFFEEGEVVIRQGTEPGKFYLIEEGKLKVERWEDDEKEIVNFLQEGDFFGEKALVEDSTRAADVKCLTDCNLFSISREDFAELLEDSPQFHKVLKDRIQSYGTEEPPVPYKEMIRKELSAMQDMEVETPEEEEDLSAEDEEKGWFRKLQSLYYREVRFPFIQQPDQMACGPTCIQMIAKYYGKHFSNNRLLELANVDRSGASLADLASAAEKIGFSTRGMKLSYDRLTSVSLPCMVHWQGYHYVVVYRIDDDHVWVSDPAKGRRKYDREYFEENWTGVTLLFEKTPEFDRQEEDETSITSFLSFLKPYKLILLEVLGASLLLNIFGLATPIFTQIIVDKIVVHESLDLLHLLFGGMVILLLFKLLTKIFRKYLIIHTSLKVDIRMLVRFYKHLLSLPLGFFKIRKIGDFTTRFAENTKIRDFLTNTAMTLVLDVLMIVVYMSLMMYYSMAMAGFVLLLFPLFIILTVVFTPILKKLNQDSFQARAEARGQLIESLHGIDTIKTMNTEQMSRWKWENKFVNSLNVDFRLQNYANVFNSIGDFLGSLGTVFILWYGAQQVIGGAMTIGELMAFSTLMGSVITPINRLIRAWDDIQQTMVSVNRINDVLSAEPEIRPEEEGHAAIQLEEPEGKIEFENVYFRYGGENDPWILSDIDLTVEPGETAALVGRSGSGKSTLVRLISHLYEVDEGTVRIDGYDVENLSLAGLRQAVGYVLQENYLFDMTVAKNISFGDTTENMDRVIQAAEQASAHEFISQLPDGYETRVGESGIQLSGGQIQRIAIARVLYTDPDILVFDEATSDLDSESEQAIQSNLDRVFAERTTVVIAHRLSTVRDADQIFILDAGEIIERGSHESLMEEEGLYHYMVHQQMNLG